MSTDYKSVRRDFLRGELSEEGIKDTPVALLRSWYDDAAAAAVMDVNAMTLSTLGRDGFPASRIVLMRDLTEEGLSFFTNYNSEKGAEISENPKGSLLFFWPGLERQVRISGLITKVPGEQSDAYFQTRPRESQIGAWASPQSAVLSSRKALEESYAAYAAKFEGVASVPRPPHWGGYILKPMSFEFWQGRESRLHDRLKATLQQHQWVWKRLAP